MMTGSDRLKELQIKASIMSDAVIGLMEIAIEAHDGIAMLTGEVQTIEQKAIAEDRAYEIDGIYEVANEITVNPNALRNVLICQDINEPESCIPRELGGKGTAVISSIGYALDSKLMDKRVESRVLANLAAQKSLDTSNVKMCVEDGLICVTGSVKDQYQAVVLRNVALRTDGVMGLSWQVNVLP